MNWNILDTVKSITKLNLHSKREGNCSIFTFIISRNTRNIRNKWKGYFSISNTIPCSYFNCLSYNFYTINNIKRNEKYVDYDELLLLLFITSILQFLLKSSFWTIPIEILCIWILHCSTLIVPLIPSTIRLLDEVILHRIWISGIKSTSLFIIM